MEAPQLLKHFFLLKYEKQKRDDESKECDRGSLQTYRNDLRRYFLKRPCPPAPDNFDIEKNEEFDEVERCPGAGRRLNRGNMVHRSSWPSKSTLASPSCLVEQCHAPWHASAAV